MGDGPPGFRQGSSCPVVLRVPARPAPVSTTGLSPSLAVLPRTFVYLHRSISLALQPHLKIQMVWATPRSLATTSGISVLISFPEGTEMFQFPSFASPSLCIQLRASSTFLDDGFPIRRSTDQRLLTAPRCLSQFCHVLHRLLVPRHPPNALTSLTTEPFTSHALSRSRRAGSSQARSSFAIDTYPRRVDKP